MPLAPPRESPHAPCCRYLRRGQQHDQITGLYVDSESTVLHRVLDSRRALKSLQEFRNVHGRLDGSAVSCVTICALSRAVV